MKFLLAALAIAFLAWACTTSGHPGLALFLTTILGMPLLVHILVALNRHLTLRHFDAACATWRARHASQRPTLTLDTSDAFDAIWKRERGNGRDSWLSPRRSEPSALVPDCRAFDTDATSFHTPPSISNSRVSRARIRLTRNRN